MDQIKLACGIRKLVEDGIKRFTDLEFPRFRGQSITDGGGTSSGGKNGAVLNIFRYSADV